MIRANNITGALDEYYQWLFVSAGLGYDVVFIDRLLQVKGGYRLLFNGELEVDFTDYGYGKADVDLADGHEWCLSAEYPLLSWRSSELSLRTKKASFKKPNVFTVLSCGPSQRIQMLTIT